MARRLLTLHSDSVSLKRLTRDLDKYSGALGEVGVSAYKQTLNEYKFTMRDRSTIGPLFKKTGRLRGSWDFEVVGGTRSLQGLRGSVFSHSGYAQLHEEGGIVRAPNFRSWLYLPTIWNRKANGTSKVSPSQVVNNGGRTVRAKYVTRIGKERTFTPNAAIFPGSLEAMSFVSNYVLIDQVGFPMFSLVKAATYAPKLGTREQEPIYTERLMKRLSDKVAEPLEE